MSSLHLPHAEMVHGKARGNVPWAHWWHDLCPVFVLATEATPFSLTHSNAATSRVISKTFLVAWRVIKRCPARRTAANASVTGESACQKAAASSPARCLVQTAATRALLPVIKAAAAHAPPALPRYRAVPLRTAGLPVAQKQVTEFVQMFSFTSGLGCFSTFSHHQKFLLSLVTYFPHANV